MNKVFNSFAIRDSILPSIMFNIEIDTSEHSSAIIGVEGWLKTVDNKIIAPLHESYSDTSAHAMKLSASGSSKDKDYFVQGTYKVDLISQLDQKCLEKIEDSRKTYTKHAVVFKLELILRNLDSKALLAHFYYLDPKETIGKPLQVQSHRVPIDVKMVVEGYDSTYSSDKTNAWIISGASSPTFLEVSIKRLELTWSINAVDWVQDYIPYLGLRKRIMVEIPSEGEIFQKAMAYLIKAETAFSNWDTKSVFANCREIGSLLDNQVREKWGTDNFIYKERWGRAYSGFKSWASLDLHIEDIKQKQDYRGKELEIGRQDAEHLLLNTKLLIKYMQEILAN